MNLSTIHTTTATMPTARLIQILRLTFATKNPDM